MGLIFALAALVILPAIIVAGIVAADGII